MSTPHRVLITGGGRGLGHALVQECRRRGHLVAATVRNPADSATDDGDVGVSFLHADMADSRAIASAVADAERVMGGIDIVINNAGVNAMSFPGGRGTLSIDTLDPEAMAGIIAVNTIAPLLVAKAALPALRSSPFPRIVNISSWLGSIERAGNGNYAYGASKAALNMATRLLAHELERDGIVVFAVNPGWMQTSMGGSRAELRPQDSASGILDVIERSGPLDSGRFLQWDGSEHPW